MGKLKSPTYKRFITGPLLRFDDRNSGYSRLARDANATKGFGPFQYRNVIFQKDQRKAARKGYERKDYALYWG
ncbi:hypothetical protein C6A37_12085, partial [Desulfobacteraceae bacterium SEEP-SAG9]